jgi:hypothetical protein
MTAGLTLPFVTAADPDRAGEGSLDPLGLARIADRLADELAPEVTARMSRIRFVTAIAVASHVLLDPADLVGPDGTPAYLAFEWHVVEAFERSRPESGTDAVPGIQKARARLRESRRHLDAASYLQTPKVFGFHGVYKRLARDFEVVDDDLVLLAPGESLIERWERDQGLDGFSSKRRASAGGKFATTLADEVRRALEKGSVQLGPTSRWWRSISQTLAPGSTGQRERRQLWKWLIDPRHAVRRELVLLIADTQTPDALEREVVEQLLRLDPSAELRARLRAVEAFEAAVRPLDDGFRLLRSIASQRTPSPVTSSEVAQHATFERVTSELPDALKVATERLEEVGLGVELEAALRQLGERMPSTQLVESLLDRHDAVQKEKGKRPWFERDDRGFVVRGIGRFDEPFEERVQYLHPYRIYALRSFARDLRHSAGPG